MDVSRTNKVINIRELSDISKLRQRGGKLRGGRETELQLFRLNQ